MKLIVILWTSLAYITSFFVVYFFINPTQKYLFNGQYLEFSFFFFPYGIKYLAAWLYSWRSILAIAPGALIGHLMIFGSAGFATVNILVFAIGITVCPVIFYTLERCGYKKHQVSDLNFSWRSVMIIGLLASVCNSILTNTIYGLSWIYYVGFIIGDISGLFFLLLSFIFVLKLLKKKINF